jgi:hypothetical protein
MIQEEGPHNEVQISCAQPLAYRASSERRIWIPCGIVLDSYNHLYIPSHRLLPRAVQYDMHEAGLTTNSTSIAAMILFCSLSTEYCRHLALGNNDYHFDGIHQALVEPSLHIPMPDFGRKDVTSLSE